MITIIIIEPQLKAGSAVPLLVSITEPPKGGTVTRGIHNKWSSLSHFDLNVTFR